MSSKKILVTGAAGFIGYHLSKLLSIDHELTLIDNFTRNKLDSSISELINKSNVRFINADMTKKDFYADLDSQYDFIVHLAAINGTKYFYEKPYQVLNVNILSLMNILEWINGKNCKKFIFSSSSEAYAGTISEFSHINEYLPTNEEIPLSIDNPFNERYSYGGSKLIGELLTINYFKSIKSSSYSIVRYHNIYGPRMGNEHVIPEFCRRIYDKEDPFNIYGGHETRAFCFIDDAIEATKRVLFNKKCNGEIIHIGNDNEEIKIISLANKLLSMSDKDFDIKINPSPTGSVKRRCPDISKLKLLTNFQPKINIDEGLKITSSWYFKNYKSSDKNKVI